MGYNKIYNEGAWELAEALSENPSLLGLDIQRNEISDDGAEWIRGLLASNCTIEEVDMRSNQLSPEVVESFGKSFAKGSTPGGSKSLRRLRKTTRTRRSEPWSARAEGASPRKSAERAARKAARQAARGR